MILAAGRVSDKWAKRCNTPLQGQGSDSVIVNGLAQGRIGDLTIPYEEIVPCPTCCKTYSAPVFTGSPKVIVNGRAALRLSDLALGISGQFPLFQGAPTVFLS